MVSERTAAHLFEGCAACFSLVLKISSMFKGSLYRRETEAFAYEMRTQLDANTPAKGNFNNWHPTLDHLMQEIEHHQAKLFRALREGNRAKISEYSADIANYAMKAHQDYGLQ